MARLEDLASEEAHRMQHVDAGDPYALERPYERSKRLSLTLSSERIAILEAAAPHHQPTHASPTTAHSFASTDGSSSSTDHRPLANGHRLPIFGRRSSNMSASSGSSATTGRTSRKTAATPQPQTTPTSTGIDVRDPWGQAWGMDSPYDATSLAFAFGSATGPQTSGDSGRNTASGSSSGSSNAPYPARPPAMPSRQSVYFSSLPASPSAVIPAVPTSPLPYNVHPLSAEGHQQYTFSQMDHSSSSAPVSLSASSSSPTLSPPNSGAIVGPGLRPTWSVASSATSSSATSRASTSSNAGARGKRRSVSFQGDLPDGIAELSRDAAGGRRSPGAQSWQERAVRSDHGHGSSPSLARSRSAQPDPWRGQLPAPMPIRPGMSGSASVNVPSLLGGQRRSPEYVLESYSTPSYRRSSSATTSGAGSVDGRSIRSKKSMEAANLPPIPVDPKVLAKQQKRMSKFQGSVSPNSSKVDGKRNKAESKSGYAPSVASLSLGSSRRSADTDRMSMVSGISRLTSSAGPSSSTSPAMSMNEANGTDVLAAQGSAKQSRRKSTFGWLSRSSTSSPQQHQQGRPSQPSSDHGPASQSQQQMPMPSSISMPAVSTGKSLGFANRSEQSDGTTSKASGRVSPSIATSRSSTALPNVYLHAAEVPPVPAIPTSLPVRPSSSRASSTGATSARGQPLPISRSASPHTLGNYEPPSTAAQNDAAAADVQGPRDTVDATASLSEGQRPHVARQPLGQSSLPASASPLFSEESGPAAVRTQDLTSTADEHATGTIDRIAEDDGERAKIAQALPPSLPQISMVPFMSSRSLSTFAGGQPVQMQFAPRSGLSPVSSSPKQPQLGLQGPQALGEPTSAAGAADPTLPSPAGTHQRHLGTNDIHRHLGRPKSPDMSTSSSAFSSSSMDAMALRSSPMPRPEPVLTDFREPSYPSPSRREKRNSFTGSIESVSSATHKRKGSWTGPTVPTRKSSLPAASPSAGTSPTTPMFPGSLPLGAGLGELHSPPSVVPGQRSSSAMGHLEQSSNAASNVAAAMKTSPSLPPTLDFCSLTEAIETYNDGKDPYGPDDGRPRPFIPLNAASLSSFNPNPIRLAAMAARSASSGSPHSSPPSSPRPLQAPALPASPSMNGSLTADTRRSSLSRSITAADMEASARGAPASSSAATGPARSPRLTPQVSSSNSGVSATGSSVYAFPSFKQPYPTYAPSHHSGPAPLMNGHGGSSSNTLSSLESRSNTPSTSGPASNRFMPPSSSSHSGLDYISPSNSFHTANDVAVSSNMGGSLQNARNSSDSALNGRQSLGPVAEESFESSSSATETRNNPPEQDPTNGFDTPQKALRPRPSDAELPRQQASTNGSSGFASATYASPDTPRLSTAAKEISSQADNTPRPRGSAAEHHRTAAATAQGTAPAMLTKVAPPTTPSSRKSKTPFSLFKRSRSKTVGNEQASTRSLASASTAQQPTETRGTVQTSSHRHQTGSRGSPADPTPTPQLSFSSSTTSTINTGSEPSDQFYADFAPLHPGQQQHQHQQGGLPSLGNAPPSSSASSSTTTAPGSVSRRQNGSSSASSMQSAERTPRKSLEAKLSPLSNMFSSARRRTASSTSSGKQSVGTSA